MLSDFSLGGKAIVGKACDKGRAIFSLIANQKIKLLLNIDGAVWRMR